MQLKIRQVATGPVNRRIAGRKPAETLGKRGARGFTLIEVVIAAAIVGVVFGGVINCYIQSGVRIEWTGYSLAAQSLAAEVVEQTRSASWDPAQSIPLNNLTNMNLIAASYNTSTRTYTGYSVGILDVPYSGTNSIWATNFISVQMIYVNNDRRRCRCNSSK